VILYKAKHCPWYLIREESQPSQEEMWFPIMMKGLADEGEIVCIL
jgi:hypothetical protein